MNLVVLLPDRVFLEQEGVARLVVKTPFGQVGFLEHRLDCVTSLAPGILTYDAGAGEVNLAVDEGVLVKAGDRVLVSVRNAVGGAELGGLKRAVEREIGRLDESERSLRRTLERMETDLVRRLFEKDHA